MRLFKDAINVIFYSTISAFFLTLVIAFVLQWFSPPVEVVYYIAIGMFVFSIPMNMKLLRISKEIDLENDIAATKINPPKEKR